MLTKHPFIDIINIVAGEHSAEERWKFSSAGRASALQAEGHRFEPCNFHQLGPVAQSVRALACHARGRGFEPHPGRQQFASVAQLVEQGTENPRVIGSIPIGGTIFAALAHLVERHLAKVEVASSSLVIRSTGALRCKRPLFNPQRSKTTQKLNMAPWPSGKAGACKALIPSSILGGASTNLVHLRNRTQKPLIFKGFLCFLG